MLTLINLSESQGEVANPSMNDEIALYRRLDDLRLQHRQLDSMIDQSGADSHISPLELQRLKRQRLALRDKIKEIEAILYPDIIA